ncbi:MAG: family 20 glycosylhydrolase, partial [Candidatus Pacebacteria bacterium]|nr:family 20 glycosylhydrolase [Candidatus Paceibacterota bacterium]
TNVSINDGVKDLVRRGVCRDNAYVATVDVHLAIETRKKLFGHLSEADREQLSSDEAFKLEIAADDISISAAAPEGVLRGLATLGVLGSAGKSKPAPALAQMVMYDAPRLDFRGMILSPYNNPEAVKPQIDILFLLRMNAVFPFIYSYMGPTPFPFSSHPGIGGDTSTKEDWEELAAYARARGIKVIPFHHAWSKAGYILSQPRYRHLAVRPDLDVGTRRKSAIFKNFCVSHPESAPLIHDLIEEVVDTMDLEHFFIGHDEIQFDDMNTNPRDKARDLTRWQYVLETAMKTYDVLKEQGVTMYMWADMLDPYHNGGALEMSGEKLLEKFPKDIVMMYWWYGVPLTPFLETLIAEGYPTIGCPWHNPKNVAQTIGTVYRNGGMGYCQTVWNATSPNALSANLATAIGLGAHLSWSPEDCDLERITFLPAEYYRQAAYRYGSELPWSSGGRSAEPPEEVLVSESELVDVLGFPSGSELDFLMTQARNYRGITCESFRKNGRPAGLVAAPGKANVTMSLSGRARHVTFLHCVNKQPVGMSLNTAKQEPYRGKTPGTYVFHYQDGTQAEFETRFRFHVNDWNDPAPASFAETGLSGVLSNSIEVNIPTYTWVNPHPDKELARLEIIPGTLQGLELVLLGLALD